MSSQDNIDNSINPSAPSIIQIDSGKLLPWIAISCIMAALALGMWVNMTVTSGQLFNELRSRTYDAETQALLLRSHVDELRQEIARAGLKPPPLPQELKTAR